MFTGIIETTAQVTKAAESRAGMVLAVSKPPGWKMKKGDSININGVCSTVVSSSMSVVFDYMPETLVKTAMSALKKTDAVNLERPLTLQKPLNGHIVQGHVDTAGVIKDLRKDGNSYAVTIGLQKQEKVFMRYVVPKGSVAVDGVSLTVVKVLDNAFTVHLIPYTWNHTAFKFKKPGDRVNIECDVVAKYLEQLTRKK